MKKVATALAAVAVSAGLLAGCGTSASQKAVDKVCSAGTDLHNSISAVKNDVTSLNFGKAKDELANVKTDYDNLVQAAKQLKEEEAKALQPHIDSLKSSIQSLTSVSSLSELESSLSTISSEIQSLYTQITSTLKCS